MRNITRIAAVAVLTVLAGCTGSSPQIIQIFWQHNFRYDPQNGSVTREMSLFLHVNDEDGIEDLESIYLIADVGELFWEIDKADWITDERQGEKWIGTNRLTMPSGDGFPSGDYRVVLVDKAGERSQSDLFISPIDGSVLPERFSRLSLTAGEARIGNGGGRRHILWFYNPAGELIKSYASADPEIRIDSVLSARERGTVTEVYLYKFESKLGIGLITGPVVFPG